MITYNGNKARYLFLGSLSIDRAYMGDELIFRTPQYALAYTDSQTAQTTVFDVTYSDGTTSEVKKVFSEAESPVRLDFLKEGSPEDITQIKYHSGKLSKIIFSGYDFSKITSFEYMFNHVIQAGWYLKSIIISDCTFPENAILKHMLYGADGLTEIDFPGCKFGTTVRPFEWIMNNTIKKASLGSFKHHISSDTLFSINFEWTFKNCPLLEYADISGITFDPGLFEQDLDIRETVNCYLEIFSDCPAIKKIRIDFSMFYLWVLLFHNGYQNFVQPEIREQIKALDLDKLVSKSYLQSLEFFEVTGLDDYPDILED